MQYMSMICGSFFGPAKKGVTKEERDDTRGSILLPSTSVLDSDEWRAAFSELSLSLSRSEVPFSFLTYFRTTSDVVPLINGELESFSLRQSGTGQRTSILLILREIEHESMYFESIM